MADVVRTLIPTDARLPTRRTFEERVYVRWPGVYAALARAGDRLPRRSRLRRAGLLRATLSGWGGWARWDLDLVLVRFAPDYRLEALPQLVAAGMRNVYHGHSGAREAVADLRDAWDKMDPVPEEILDAGNVVIVRGHLRLHARASGIALDTPMCCVYWLERGLIVRQHDEPDLDEALRAAGISAAGKGDPTRQATSAA
jgi:ketosteroid isomerase-like protein